MRERKGLLCGKGEDVSNVQQQEQHMVDVKDQRVGRIKDNAKVLRLGNRIELILLSGSWGEEMFLTFRHVVLGTYKQNCLVSIRGTDIRKEGWGWRRRFNGRLSVPRYAIFITTSALLFMLSLLPEIPISLSTEV